MYRVVLACAAYLAAFWSVMPARAVEAYIFRGAGDFSFIADGLNFSTGMDRLGRELRGSGVEARVYRWEAGEIAYREIMRRRPESVALMGHSMGALTSMALAKRLQGSGIRVAYMGLIDIPGPGGVVPANVEWAENFYHAFPVFGQLTSGRGYKGFLSNRYVMGQVHITMDKAKLVHNAMISAIWQADARERHRKAHHHAGHEAERQRPERTPADQRRPEPHGDHREHVVEPEERMGETRGEGAVFARRQVREPGRGGRNGEGGGKGGGDVGGGEAGGGEAGGGVVHDRFLVSVNPIPRDGSYRDATLRRDRPGRNRSHTPPRRFRSGARVYFPGDRPHTGANPRKHPPPDIRTPAALPNSPPRKMRDP